ncbi:hypothetical protein [Mycobacterium camsae]|uniref:hypothetical protein n=1 Tax=Mycobacterium gordonae TaxID=1778 RepID=UPI00197CF5DB|nr:hypothetical protein [Mycobacterium gordonae]
MNSDVSNNPAPPRRHSTGALVGAGLAGVALGAAAAFAVTGLVFTVRVQLPPPPYPQLSSAPAPPPSTIAPTSTSPGLLPERPSLPVPPGPP